MLQGGAGFRQFRARFKAAADRSRLRQRRVPDWARKGDQGYQNYRPITLPQVAWLAKSPLPLSPRERSLWRFRVLDVPPQPTDNVMNPQPTEHDVLLDAHVREHRIAKSILADAARNTAPLQQPKPAPASAPVSVRTPHSTRLAEPCVEIPDDPAADERELRERRERDAAYDQSTIAAGVSAWRRLRATKSLLSDHRLVGAALLVGQRLCMEKVKTPRPRGVKYVRAFSAWMAEHGFSDLQKTRRHCCMAVAANWEAVQAAMKTLSPARRAEMCDVTNVWRWYRERNKQPRSNGHDGKDPGWRGRKSIDLARAREAISAVSREAPELAPDVARAVAFAVMRACGLSVPRELFCASTTVKAQSINT
jgi:hypothetical protein